jgi:uncharacterized protein (TIGR03086 family)
VFDLTPTADPVIAIVEGVRDDQLDAPTPCTDWTLRDLLAHVQQFATVFTCNARKTEVTWVDGLPEDWRTALPQQLAELARAWQEPSAWQGRVSAGGVEMSAEDNAVVAAEELVVHGWDLARATGQHLEPGSASLAHLERFLEVFAGPLASGKGPYGPAVPVPADAPRWDRLLGLAGRDPGWRPTTR